MSKTTTEDRDGFRITTVDHTADDEALRNDCTHDFGASRIVKVSHEDAVDYVLYVIEHYCSNCGLTLGEYLESTPEPEITHVRRFQSDDWPDIAAMPPRFELNRVWDERSFNRAIAETWPINWDWSDYRLKTAYNLYKSCAVDQNRRELVNKIFGAIQSWHTGKPPFYAAHVDPEFLDYSEQKMLDLAQVLAATLSDEAAP